MHHQRNIDNKEQGDIIGRNNGDFKFQCGKDSATDYKGEKADKKREKDESKMPKKHPKHQG